MVVCRGVPQKGGKEDRGERAGGPSAAATKAAEAEAEAEQQSQAQQWSLYHNPGHTPFDRDAARDHWRQDTGLPKGEGGEELLSRMEEEFVAKSGALVGRMTVAAAQDNMVELSSELETLQDFSHMLRAHGLSEALGSLERVIEENQTSAELKRTLQTVDVAAERVRSYIIQSTESGGGGGGGGAERDVLPPTPPEWLASQNALGAAQRIPDTTSPAGLHAGGSNKVVKEGDNSPIDEGSRIAALSTSATSSTTSYNHQAPVVTAAGPAPGMIAGRVGGGDGGMAQAMANGIMSGLSRGTSDPESRDVTDRQVAQHQPAPGGGRKGRGATHVMIAGRITRASSRRRPRMRVVVVTALWTTTHVTVAVMAVEAGGRESRLHSIRRLSPAQSLHLCSVVR